MFDKLKLKIKLRLIKFLEIDKLNTELKNLGRDVKSELYHHGRIIDHNSKAIETIHNTLENVVHIGTDVVRNPYGRSWAVICIEGKMNIVKFVDLGRNEAREITEFLRRYEGGRHCIDAPCKEMFYDGLFKF